MPCELVLLLPPGPRGDGPVQALPPAAPQSSQGLGHGSETAIFNSQIMVISPTLRQKLPNLPGLFRVVALLRCRRLLELPQHPVGGVDGVSVGGGHADLSILGQCKAKLESEVGTIAKKREFCIERCSRGERALD